MDWTHQIERNRAALVSLLAVLFRTVGLVDGRAASTIKRYVRSNVLRPLRPAESALRRLVLLVRRLVALKTALETLPKQAKRLVRLQARRKLHAMRPGRAPGYRETPLFEVDEVLRECQWLGASSVEV